MPADARGIVQQVAPWMESGSLSVPFTLRLDPLGAVMALVVTVVGFLIHVYSTAYMHEERDSEYARYFSYLNLFAAFMLVLVLGANFPVMFVGWEGVGLCSYLLIGFWFTKQSASDAGKKAFIVNRIGDFGFLLGIFVVWSQFGSLDFQEVARQAGQLPPEATFGALSLATLLLFVGATGKSAQIPLYVWLPDAMEGPTPVSALIHAATMVTAGVYMIGRNAVLFSHAPETLAIVAGIGVATALMAGTIGLVQNDIKRVLAYSTVSQLGLMFVAMGVGAFAAGIFHLYTHAFFKALLFLGSGAVIHALAGEQDIRRMGGLQEGAAGHLLDVPDRSAGDLGRAAAVGVLQQGRDSLAKLLRRAHAGLGRGGGRVAPDGDLHVPARVPDVSRRAARRRTACGRRESRRSPERQRTHTRSRWRGGGHDHGGAGGHGGHLHDAPPAMAIVLILLAVGSVLAGYVGVPAVLGGSNHIEHFLAPSFAAPGLERARRARRQSRRSPSRDGRRARPRRAGEGGTRARKRRALPSDHGAELGLMAFSSGIALAGIGIAAYFFLRRREAADRVAARFAGAHRVLLNKYYVDEFYDAAIVQPIRRTSERALWRVFDAGVIDGAVNGAGSFVNGASAILRRLQTGSMRAYALSVFVGVVLILGYYVWR